METTQALRKDAPTTGSFVTVASAFPTAPEGLRNMLKMEFITQAKREKIAGEKDNPFLSEGLEVETVFSTDWLLVDLGAVDPSSIDMEVLVRDCDILKRIARESPDELIRIMKAFNPTAPLSDIDEAIKTAKRIGFTEERAAQEGGGLFFVVVGVLAAGALLSGCAHCNTHSKGKKTTPSQ